VILFPGANPPALWRFFDYVEAQQNPIQEWYQKLSFEGKISFNTVLKNTRKVALPIKWAGFKYLKGKPAEEKIWQLDFISDKRQYRVLGVFGQGRKSAVLILGCYHKGDVYTPPNALETARKRAKALREGKAETRERTISDDI